MNANAQHDAIDTTIDRALSTLRDAQPRPGLEGRILASLEHRTATPQPAGFHLSAHLALWTATAATIVAVASMMILHHRTTVTVQSAKSSVILSEARSAQSKNPDTIRSTTASEPFSTSNLTHTAALTTHTSSSRPERVARSGETPVFENAAITEPPNAASTIPTDAQALADLHAPSHPAPPLPLTPQEKLFLRMLRYGNATQLAELNPIVRAQHDDDETTAFKAFFPDPPPLQQPNGDTE